MTAQFLTELEEYLETDETDETEEYEDTTNELSYRSLNWQNIYQF